jgi:hypothetical protein
MDREGMFKDLIQAGDTAQWYNTCLACTMPWVQFPSIEKTKQNKTPGMVAHDCISSTREAKIGGL